MYGSTHNIYYILHNLFCLSLNGMSSDVKLPFLFRSELEKTNEGDLRGRTSGVVLSPDLRQDERREPATEIRM